MKVTKQDVALIVAALNLRLEAALENDEQDWADRWALLIEKILFLTKKPQTGARPKRSSGKKKRAARRKSK